MGHVALRALSDQSVGRLFSSWRRSEIRLLISMLNNDNNVEQSTAICCGHHPPHNHFQESRRRLCPKKDAADAWLEWKCRRSMMLEIILSSESGTAFKVHSCELEINRYYDDKLVFADLCCERGHGRQPTGRTTLRTFPSVLCLSRPVWEMRIIFYWWQINYNTAAGDCAVYDKEGVNGCECDEWPSFGDFLFIGSGQDL